MLLTRHVTFIDNNFRKVQGIGTQSIFLMQFRQISSHMGHPKTFMITHII